MSLQLKIIFYLCFLFVDVTKMSMPTISFLIQQGRPSFYSNRLHGFSATILDVTRMMMLSVPFFIKQEWSAFFSDRFHEVSATILYVTRMLLSTVSFLIKWERSTSYSDRLHDFSVTIQVLYKCQCNHFFFYTARKVEMFNGNNLCKMFPKWT